MAIQTAYFSPTASVTLPKDWNINNNKIECVAPGGNSVSSVSPQGGHGGGAYAAITNLSDAANTVETVQIKTGGGSADTVWFKSTSTVLADYGRSATTATGASGGLVANCVGTTKFAGGNGGNGVSTGNGGGGGAAGPNGAGANGANGSGSTGGNGGTGDNGNATPGGTGGTSGNAGGNSTADNAWPALSLGVGSGGGGGGSGASGGGDTGTDYGCGGGGSSNTHSALGAGDGFIVVTYTPLFPSIRWDEPAGIARKPGPEFFQNFAPLHSGLLIPFYIYPTGYYLNELVYWMTQYPKVPVVVVLNPNSGPGSVTNSDYTNAITTLHGVGATVIGYTDTNYTAIALATVESTVDTWVSLYPAIDGIFFDRADNTAGNTGYYHSLYNYVRTTKGLARVITNQGTTTPAGYFPSNPLTADQAVIYENDGFPTASQISNSGVGGWQNKAILVSNDGWNSLTAAQVDQLVAQNYLINISDSPSATAYQTLPAYLGTIFQYLATGVWWLESLAEISYWDTPEGVRRKNPPEMFHNYLPQPTAPNNFKEGMRWDEPAGVARKQTEMFHNFLPQPVVTIPFFPLRWDEPLGVYRKAGPEVFENYLPQPTAANNFIPDLPWDAPLRRCVEPEMFHNFLPQPTAANSFIPRMAWDEPIGVARKAGPEMFHNYLPHLTVVNNFIPSQPWEISYVRRVGMDAQVGVFKQAAISILFPMAWDAPLRRTAVQDFFVEYAPHSVGVSFLGCMVWEPNPPSARRIGLPEWEGFFMPWQTAVNPGNWTVEYAPPPVGGSPVLKQVRKFLRQLGGIRQQQPTLKQLRKKPPTLT